MKYILAILAILTSFACVRKEGNPGQLELLATTPEGCRVYRIDAGWHHVYTTTCPGKVEWRKSCGKNCVRDIEVPTNER